MIFVGRGNTMQHQEDELGLDTGHLSDARARKYSPDPNFARRPGDHPHRPAGEVSRATPASGKRPEGLSKCACNRDPNYSGP